jgi:hypothetical protein
LRCNATAGPAGSKTAINAGTFRLQRKASSDGSRHNRLIAGRGLHAGPGDRDLRALFVFGAAAFSADTPIAASKMPITPATLRSDAATGAAPDDMVELLCTLRIAHHRAKCYTIKVMPRSA